jgi:hypothetical protein
MEASRSFPPERRQRPIGNLAEPALVPARRFSANRFSEPPWYGVLHDFRAELARMGLLRPRWFTDDDLVRRDRP